MNQMMEGNNQVSNLLQNWVKDPDGVKKVFMRLQEKIVTMENVFIAFKSRPGVSYSLRANIRLDNKADAHLFALVDIIDDDPENRWLSVCFYEETIKDNEELGNLIPEGILGEDGHCFDIFEYDEFFLTYLEGKFDEAYANSLKIQETTVNDQ